MVKFGEVVIGYHNDNSLLTIEVCCYNISRYNLNRVFIEV